MTSQSKSDLHLARALTKHCAALAACTRCSHGPEVRPIVSRARSPRAMLVGQAPGQVETAGGKPFAGRAGRTLFRWFDRIGLDEETARDWLYIAAITRCYPGPHPSGRGDRVPSPAERARCADWLNAELAMMKPKLIIPVGRLAIDRFLGAVALAEVVGRVHEFAHDGGTSEVIPLPHPSGASSWIHQPGNAALLDQSLELVRQRLFHEPRVAQSERRKAS